MEHEPGALAGRARPIERCQPPSFLRVPRECGRECGSGSDYHHPEQRGYRRENREICTEREDTTRPGIDLGKDKNREHGIRFQYLAQQDQPVFQLLLQAYRGYDRLQERPLRERGNFHGNQRR